MLDLGFISNNAEKFIEKLTNQLSILDGVNIYIEKVVYYSFFVFIYGSYFKFIGKFTKCIII